MRRRTWSGGTWGGGGRKWRTSDEVAGVRSGGRGMRWRAQAVETGGRERRCGEWGGDGERCGVVGRRKLASGGVRDERSSGAKAFSARAASRQWGARQGATARSGPATAHSAPVPERRRQVGYPPATRHTAVQILLGDEQDPSRPPLAQSRGSTPIRAMHAVRSRVGGAHPRERVRLIRADQHDAGRGAGAAVALDRPPPAGQQMVVGLEGRGRGFGVGDEEKISASRRPATAPGRTASKRSTAERRPRAPLIWKSRVSRPRSRSRSSGARTPGTTAARPGTEHLDQVVTRPGLECQEPANEVHVAYQRRQSVAGQRGSACRSPRARRLPRR